jgi:hypothetical protein
MTYKDIKRKLDVIVFRRIAIRLAACLVVSSSGVTWGGDEPELLPHVTAAPEYEEFLVLPIRIHILTSTELPDVDCRLSHADVRRILGKVNRIWNKAGIHWGLEKLVREPAAQQARFRAVRELAAAGYLPAYWILFPKESRTELALNLYYIHEFPVNGVWLGREALVKDAAELRVVEGGSDEPIPRVSAHELGHALGLSHCPDDTNLLALGTTGTLLDAAEVTTARKLARRAPGAASVAEVRHSAEAAEAAGRRDQARRLWTWLAEIPGTGAEAARAHRDRLERDPQQDPEATTSDSTRP